MGDFGGSLKLPIVIVPGDKEGTMEDQEKEKHKDPKQESKVPFCTTAPSPEHARAEAEDEPCDDGRAGE